MVIANHIVGRLASFLEESGLRRVRDVSPSNDMGIQLIEWQGPSLSFLLTWDRGFWDLKLASTEAPESWYDVKLLTYLFSSSPQLQMTIDDQISYVISNWTQAISLFDPIREADTRLRLDAAKKDRARIVYTVWPDVIRELELLLIEKGLRCEVRKEPRYLYDAMDLKYAADCFTVQSSSAKGWLITLSGLSQPSAREYKLNWIRSIVRPNRPKLAFPEMASFMRENWDAIAALFSPENADMAMAALDDVASKERSDL